MGSYGNLLHRAWRLIDAGFCVTRKESPTALTVAVLALLIFAGVRIASVDAEIGRQVQSLRETVTLVPGESRLLGFDAHENTEWAPADIENEVQHVVLFPVSASTAAREVTFWEGVSSILSQKVDSDVQFVGVCDQGMVCTERLSIEDTTILSFMDPNTMHSVSIARSQGRALLYVVLEGRAIAASIEVLGDQQAIAEDLSKEITNQLQAISIGLG